MVLETWGLRHELQPGLWSRSAKDSTGHKGNHHTWASNNDNLLKKTEKVITTMPPGLTAFAANPVWGGSETMLALISCDPGLHDIQWMWNGCRGAKTGVNFYSNQLAPEDLRRELYPGGFPPIFEPLWMISMADIQLLVSKGFLFIIKKITFGHINRRSGTGEHSFIKDKSRHPKDQDRLASPADLKMKLAIFVFSLFGTIVALPQEKPEQALERVAGEWALIYSKNMGGTQSY